VAGEYCWATTHAVGRSFCGRSGSSVLEFVFQLAVLCIHTVAKKYDIPRRKYCISREVSVK